VPVSPHFSRFRGGLFPLLAAGLMTASLHGCSRRPDAYVLGLASPQTMAYGIQNRAGAQLAVDEINAAGGIGGVPLKLLIRDDQASGVTAVNVAAEFVKTRSVIAVIGHAGSGAMVAAARVYDTGKLVAVGTTPSTPDLTGLSPWVFRLISSDSVNGITLARFASAVHADGHPPRAAILYANDAYGRGLAEAFAKHFDGTIISNDPVGDSTDLEPYVAYFKQQRPDVVFVASSENIGLAFLRAAHAAGFRATFLGGDGWQGVVADTTVSEGAYVGTPFTAQHDDSTTRRFVAAFTAKYGRVPDAHAALAYDAAKLLARAIAQGGATRDGVRRYLSGLTGATAFHGVTGPVQFGVSSNDPVGNNFRVTVVRHGLMLAENGR